MSEWRAPALRATAILSLLERHQLAYVVIGGIGAVIWGSPRNTDDLDICAARDDDNLAKLADALNELDARLRSPGFEREGFRLPMPWDAGALRSYTSVALVTDLGWFDVSFRPDGTEGYPDLIQRARAAELGGVPVRVADLDDIIRSKVAASREKDLAALPHLRELRDRRKERGLD